MTETKAGFKPYLGLTFLIGFGFFTMGLMDILYDTYVPIFLARFIEKNFVIGGLMTLDNLLAVFLIPFVSLWSDNTRTRIGRRMPFIVVLLPLTALCFSLIPYAAAQSLGAILLVIFGLNLVKQSVRGPVVALMPDTIPGEFRSEANGIINTMGALGAIISTVGLARLMDMDIVLPILGRTKDTIPFPIAGVLVILATLLVFSFVREKNHDEKAKAERIPLMRSLKAIAGEKDKSALWILIALFMWFLAYQGILPFLGKLCKDVFEVTQNSKAALPASVVAIAQTLFAIPSGYVAHRIGRRKAIRGSLLVLAGLLSVVAVLASPLAEPLGVALRFNILLGTMFVYGIFWITIITNSFPMLWQMATFGTIGVYTGLYYTFSQTAAITAPPLTGAIIDFIGYAGIFAFAACCMLAAFFVMSKVTSGEPGDDAKRIEPQANKSRP
ncbi:MAG: MFS transporter [Spirochaetes bacterium GWD1_61_31]|nr:MAG: MFS transporter [Spirochaetes bacterium GWB1_60_80]OHD35320.1 MAG: MFS transporter [Spirochaetes bacterium GWC1_61_12]OHD37293.1 MAG: MFS transporter [Spirochaetes bacterium GWD1_61_31]OHD44976.1 MAG: MFS transporter [Spirochaetes bacterium GWE1_60_18]OHD60085.1 MAG: MFS transporter [Spirochaetes bacterium GWF1_60_12]HAP43652.1 MFS transporter [Spirochaetaceae bacterium]